MRRICTVCFIERDGKILLGKKKRGFGTGRWNGFGGKMEPGEEVFESMKREAMEEFSLELTADRVQKVGELDFKVLDNSDWNEIFIHVYYGTCDGEAIESEELLPGWFGKDKIPYDEMWVDDIYWIPMLLEGKKFKGSFILTESNVLSEWKVEEVTSFGEGV